MKFQQDGSAHVDLVNKVNRPPTSLLPSFMPVGPLDPKLLVKIRGPISIEGAWPLYHGHDL